MKAIVRKYSKEELALRGEALFDSSISEQVRDADPEWVVAIGVDSGDFELHPDTLEAVERLQQRNAEAQTWIRRVGSRSVMRFGSRREPA